MRVTPEQVALVRAVLAFANLRRIRSTRQVEQLFERVPLIWREFKVLHPGEHAAYRDDQQELRGWLEQIARGRGATVAKAVAQRMRTIGTRASFDASRMEVGTILALSGVQAAYAFGVALLLSRSAGLSPRLGHCDAPGCGRFNLDLRSRQGRPQRYCNEAHRAAADAVHSRERVRHWRRKHAGDST